VTLACRTFYADNGNQPPGGRAATGESHGTHCTVSCRPCQQAEHQMHKSHCSCRRVCRVYTGDTEHVSAYISAGSGAASSASEGRVDVGIAVAVTHGTASVTPRLLQ
jgi:hypothetical protein